MSAKQILVPLFVRVPALLIQRLKRSVAGRNTSMSSEVARILDQGIAASFPLELKHRADAINATLYKSQFEALEWLVLHTTDTKDEAEAAQVLSSLRSGMLKLRKQRQQVAQDLEIELKERVGRLEESTKLGLGAFAALDPACAISAPGRLSKNEWRRRNLHGELAGKGHGAQSRLAESLKCTRGYVSQLLVEPGAKGHRNITAKTARKIEVALHLQTGALDKVPPVSDMDGLLYSAGELSKVLRKIPSV